MMTRWDDYADELLSAYLDGEVSFEEREQIAQQLARNAEYASRLEMLRGLDVALRGLPRYRLRPEIQERILRQIGREAIERADHSGAQEIEGELLSAYVDGEVSAEERRQIAQLLATSADYAGRLEALQALQQALRDLPRYRLRPEIHERIRRKIQQLAADSERASQVSEAEAELLSGYLDGEVSDEERQRVERGLSENAACRSQLEDLRTLGAELRGLSAFHLDAGFADRVLQRIEEESQTTEPTGSGTTPEVQPARRFETPRDRSSWRGFVWTSLAVAAAIVLMVSLRHVPTPGPTPGPISPGPLNSPLTLIDRKVWDRLVLVYEVSIDPEGVNSGVFFQLLKRHGIRILDTVPVPEREQRSLLKCRFLEGAEVLDGGAAAGMDEIRLYLVYCSGRQAEAMWTELQHGPQGFASSRMNFTTRREGGGVLLRLRGAAGNQRTMGSAVQLVANYGARASSRPRGIFGTIGYIDPDLLAPPPAPGESILREAEKASAERLPNESRPPEQDGNFPCELLFVVRNLFPVADAAPAEAKQAAP